MGIPLRCIYLLFVALIGHGSAIARELTDVETALIRGSTNLRGNDPRSNEPKRLAQELGAEHNFDAIPLLITVNNEYIRDFFRGYRKSMGGEITDPALEAIAIHLIESSDLLGKKEPDQFDTRVVFLQNVTPYPSPQAWKVYFDALRDAYAKNFALPSDQGRTNWDIAFIALPYDLPGREEAIVKLIPLMRNGCEGRRVLGYLAQRNFSPAFGALRSLYERSNIGCRGAVVEAIGLLPDRTATEFLVSESLRNASSDLTARTTLEIIDALGATPVEAQVDFDAYAGALLGRLNAPNWRDRIEEALRNLAQRSAQARTYSRANFDQWARRANLAVLNSFLDHGFDVNAASKGKDTFSGTPLCSAVRNQSDISVVRLLVGRGALVNPELNAGCVPLIAISSSASVIGNVEAMMVAEYLIEHGANVDGVASSGSITLLQASSLGNVPLCDLLARRGANLNSRASGEYGWAGQAPIHVAIRGGDPVGIVKCLLAHGADVNVQTSAGETALFIAVTARGYFPSGLEKAHRPASLEIARLLVAHGANVSLAGPHSSDVSPIIIAHENNDPEMEEFLRNNGAHLDLITVGIRAAKRALGELTGHGH
jgi:ankyrin repeat protein